MTQLTPAQTLAQIRAQKDSVATPTGISVSDALAQIRAKQAVTPAPAPTPMRPVLGQGAAGDFSANTLRTIAEPLIRTGGFIEMGLDQTLGRGINLLKGNGFIPTNSGQQAFNAADISAQNHSGGFAGKAGDVLGTVAPYVTPLGLEEAGVNLATKIGLGTTEKILPRVAAYAVKKVPDLIANSAIGTSQKGSLSEGVKTGAEFTAFGMVGDALGAGIKGVKSLGDTAKNIDSLEKNYNEIAGSTKSGKKASVKATKVTNAKNAAGTTGTTPQRTLAEAGIVPKVNGTKLDTIEQADSLRQSITPLKDANRAALQEVQYAIQPINLSHVEEQAVKTARSSDNIHKGTADSLENEIRSAFSGFRSHYGENVPITILDDIKSARWGRAPFDSTRPLQNDANYLIAKIAQKTIEETASKAGYEEVAQLNRHIGDQIDAAKFLESLDAKTLKGGQLGRYIFQGIGSTLGHSIPAKIIYAMGGDAVARTIINMSVAGPVKRLVLRNLEKTDPAAYTEAMAWLEKQGALRDVRPLLPPATPGPIINQGRAIQASPKGPIEYVGPETTVGGYSPNTTPRTLRP